ncbi:MAG TPA: 1,3-beta-galactosyl-N-acetylhexosamine phosphorylase, partial [Lachnospiraceae bacterium]|nr:1,3-beta-galactosyl-N-acetylhexosamine phosphorylase [Lachnospiraceae bacterium]
MSYGRVTIPGEENYYNETMAVARRWKADAIRDCDGTRLDGQLKQSELKIYNAYFPTRAQNQFIREHMEECPQIYLMSKRTLATRSKLTIAFMDEYYQKQLVPNYHDDPAKYWEVIDRTDGTVVPKENWSLDQEENCVTISDAALFHEYTVSFLAYIIWDPVEMYNHLTNDWGDKEHEIPFDALQPHSHEFILKTMKEWLQDNPEIDVVRFTTFFYQFTLVFNQYGKEKFVDWFGYGASVSPRMLKRFEKKYGYAMRAEDFVDEGYYNSAFRVPSASLKKYMDLVQDFVTGMVRELTDLVHESGKEAMMFLGDQWIGTEPYGKYAQRMNLDAVVGSVGDGTTLRMISDIPNVKYTEGRFLPYFFPDTFYEGNDPSIEARANWVQARRAILRSPIERMGYGGYLSLADKFPKFVDTVAEITEEFRGIHDNMQGTRAYCGLKVAILNHWGKLRTWQAFTVAHALYCKEAYSYYGILESLSGMNVEVEFISFDDVLENGIDESIDVIINAGAAG